MADSKKKSDDEPDLVDAQNDRPLLESVKESDGDSNPFDYGDVDVKEREKLTGVREDDPKAERPKGADFVYAEAAEK